ncbi:restriction endonuclease subunit S [Aeromonas veronii]
MAKQMMQHKADELAAKQTIPAGYKQSEVGVIPEDWEVQPLSKLSARITDGEHLTPERTDFGYYLLSARNIHNGYLNLSDVDYVGESEYLRIRKRCNPDEGDVLISCSGTIGRVCVLPKGIECVMVRSAALIKFGDNKINGHYVQYFLQSSAGQKQIFSSLNQGAQANLFLNHIQDLRLAYPRIFAEQITIANALADTDALIAGLEQLIAKKQAIKTAAMQQLLTGRTRLPAFALRPDGTPKGYKPSELGDIPEDWEVDTLGASCKVQGGYAFKSEKFENMGVPILRIGNIQSGCVDVNDVIYCSLSEIIPKQFEVHYGDALIAMSGATIGKIGVYREESIAYLNQRVGKFVFNSNLDIKYMQYVVASNFYKQSLSNILEQGAQPNVSSFQLENIFICKPKIINEQTAIATILSDMDNELNALEQKLAKARDVKQGMMQQLLTGRIRLPLSKEA